MTPRWRTIAILGTLAVLLLAAAAEAIVRTNPLTHPPRAARIIGSRTLESPHTRRVATLSGPVSVVAPGLTSLVAAGDLTGLVAVAPTAAGRLAMAGSARLPAAPQGIAVKGDTAAVACAWQGTAFYDVSEPETPTLLTVVPSGSSARSVTFAGDFAYVADWNSGLQIISIEDTSSPAVVTFADTPGHAYDVAVVGERAYVADFEGGVRVFDIRHPDDPRPAGAWQTMPNPTGIAASGRYVYVVDEQRGLFVVDVKDPRAPRILADVACEVAPADLIVVRDRVVVSDLAGGVSLFDVSDPKAPAPLGRTQLAQGKVGLGARGSTVYFAAGRLLSAEVGR